MFYDYRCTKCEDIFEVKMSLSEKENGAAVACPNCGSNETRQMISALNIGGGSSSPGKPENAPAPSCCCGPSGCSIN